MRQQSFVSWLVFMLTIFYAAFNVTSGYIINTDEKAKIRQENIASPNESSSISAEYARANIVVLGLDNDKTRTDVIMVVSFIPSANKVAALSIPRDMMVKIGGKTAKINEVYFKGREEAVFSVVKEITGLKMDYYAVIDYEGFRKLVDLLGGVEIEVPFDMNYDDPLQNLHIHIKKGRQTLDGRKAEQFIRYRVSNGNKYGYSDGDIGRIKVQHAFISALVKQKMNVQNVAKVPDIYLILKRYVKTNIGLQDIYRYYPVLSELSDKNIEMHTLPGESHYIDGVSYFFPDRAAIGKLMEEHF